MLSVPSGSTWIKCRHGCCAPSRLAEGEQRRDGPAAGLHRRDRVLPLADLRATEDDPALAIERRREGPVARPRRDSDRCQLPGIGLGRVHAVERTLRLSGIRGHGEQPIARADQDRAERHPFRFGQRHDGQITSVLIANHEPFERRRPGRVARRRRRRCPCNRQTARADRSCPSCCKARPPRAARRPPVRSAGSQAELPPCTSRRLQTTWRIARIVCQSSSSCWCLT